LIDEKTVGQKSRDTIPLNRIHHIGHWKLSLFRCLWETHQATESSVVQSGISSQNVFYLVNPDQTLPKTQVGITFWKRVPVSVPSLVKL
jgi:hypothetical protein